MDKETLEIELCTSGDKFGNEYKSIANELLLMYGTIEKLCDSVKNANKNLVKSMIACYDAMIIKGQMGEEKKKYASARMSFIKYSGKLNEARELASVLENKLNAIKNQG